METIQVGIAGAPTLVVAASDSSEKGKLCADRVCDGVDDHLDIQWALDQLPATGGQVVLLDGTYNVEATINLDSYQTLRGCGHNTILTTSTTTLVFLSAVGGSGTEKVGIVITDMQIDGGAGAISDCGIFFEYVDYSLVQNVYSRRHVAPAGSYWSGICLINSDFNEIIANIFQGDGDGIYLSLSSNNTIVGNTCPANDIGIYLDEASNNTIVGNTCQGNEYGINFSSSNSNTITGNTCRGNGDGIYLGYSNGNTITSNTCRGNDYTGITLSSSNNNTVAGNTLTENSQDTTNSFDDITLEYSDYNNIQGNTCRAGAETNKPRYGINLRNATCDLNLVTNNDLYNDGFGTASFNDVGTNTRLNAYVVPFSDGSDPQDSGFLIDADTEYARAWMRLPAKVQQVVRMKVYARAGALSATTMALEINVNGGADNEPFNTHATAAPNSPSTSSNFAADDVIFWTLTSAEIVALLGGDSVEVKVLHEAADAGGVATNAYIRTVEIEYV